MGIEQPLQAGRRTLRAKPGRFKPRSRHATGLPWRACGRSRCGLHRNLMADHRAPLPPRVASRAGRRHPLQHVHSNGDIGMAGNSASAQLHRLHAELDELSGHGERRPPNIGAALAAATNLVERSRSAVASRTEARPGRPALRPVALAAITGGTLLATLRRRRRRPPPVAEVPTAIVEPTGRVSFRPRAFAQAVAGAAKATRERSLRARRSMARASRMAGFGAATLAAVAAASTWLAARRRARKHDRSPLPYGRRPEATVSLREVPG